MSPLGYYYPAIRLRPIVRQKIIESKADVALVFWAPEGLAATYSIGTVPKLAYYGMADPSSARARIEDAELFSGRRPNWLALKMSRKSIREWERSYLALMMDCDVVSTLGKDQAEYYARKGHPRAIYMPNMWPDLSAGEHARHRQLESGERPRIIGSLGNPATTANTYGLWYIGKELLPRLDAELGPDGYELHIFGSGEPNKSVRKLLETSPGVRMRGWVDEIDEEIRSAHVFLLANNAARYKGPHTRILHAWSLKACCVAYSYLASTIPEVVDGENVLL
ncbi:MAG: glycosyltransferase family 4 protein, partial [Candidatus Binatia bacterium]